MRGRFTSVLAGPRRQRLRGVRGYFWQGRFASAAMDEAHLYTAMRYVELNPVRARLVDAVEDWPHRVKPEGRPGAARGCICLARRTD